MAHQHPVKDTDLHFVIDPVTRVIKNNSEKIVIMQHDHQSEILTFELPRYIDMHDMSLSNAVRVHYINIGTSSKYTPVSGVYEVNDLQVDATNENLVTCSWTLTNNTTQLEGTLNFIIRFSCLTGDTIDYSWSTAIYSGIIVAKTIDSSDYVMTAIPDILEQWKASLKGDPFTYEDFTPEQLEGLRGPAGVIVSETEPTNEDHPVWIRPSGEYIVENLGISGATVGQTVKIKAVDENGVPTEWEAVDDALPLLYHGKVSEEISGLEITEIDGNPMSLSEVKVRAIFKVSTAAWCGIELCTSAKSPSNALITSEAGSVFTTAEKYYLTTAHGKISNGNFEINYVQSTQITAYVNSSMGIKNAALGKSIPNFIYSTPPVLQEMNAENGQINKVKINGNFSEVEVIIWGR